MAFTLYSLIQAAILLTNAVAVLHEERFLSKYGILRGWLGWFLLAINCLASRTYLCPQARLPLDPDKYKLVGWGAEQGIGGFGDEPGIKAQLLSLIRSVRMVMRVPLIIVNSVSILLLLLFG